MTTEVSPVIPAVSKYGDKGLEKDHDARVKDQQSKLVIKQEYPNIETVQGLLELRSIRAFRENNLVLPPEGTDASFVTFSARPDPAIWEPVR